MTEVFPRKSFGERSDPRTRSVRSRWGDPTGVYLRRGEVFGKTSQEEVSASLVFLGIAPTYQSTYGEVAGALTRQEGDRFVIPRQGRLLLGRGSDCEVGISSHRIARKHAAVFMLGTDRIALVDLAGTNGTQIFVDGAFVTIANKSVCWLSSGDEFLLADHARFVVEIVT